MRRRPAAELADLLADDRTRRDRRSARGRRAPRQRRSRSCRRRPRPRRARARARRATAARRARRARPRRRRGRARASQSSGWKSSPESSFGKKYVVFCGITSPAARARSNTARSASAGAGAPPRPRRGRRPRPRPRGAACTRRSLGAKRSTSLDVEPVAVLDERVAAVAVEHDARKLVAPAARSASPRTSPRRCAMRCVREDRQPSSRVEHEHDHHQRGRLGAVLLVERERRLVAVVAVGDQELRRRARRRRVRQPPQPVDAARARGRARASGGSTAVAVVEQEDRLELRARRAQQAQPSLLRAGVRALVREHDAGSRTARVERRRRSRCACARRRRDRRSPARAPSTRRLLARRGCRRARQAASCTCGLLLGVGQRQVDDVVRAACEVLARAARRRDHVVRRRDERRRAARPPLGVAIAHGRATHLGHGCDRSAVGSSSGERHCGAGRGSRRRRRLCGAQERAAPHPRRSLRISRWSCRLGGRISGRVWNDVDLLDSRFSEGDAVHVLGRVEKFRDRLQLEVRALEPAEADPACARAGAAPRRRRAGGLPRVPHHADPRRSAPRARRPRARAMRRRSARIPRRPTVTTRTPVDCSSTRSAWRRSATSSRSSIHASARTSSWPLPCFTTSGARWSSSPPPAFRPSDEGRLLGHVHLGLRALEAARAPSANCSTRSRRTTTFARRGRRRLPCSTTRTSSTPSARDADPSSNP